MYTMWYTLLFFKLVIVLAVEIDVPHDKLERNRWRHNITNREMTFHKIRRILRMSQLVHMDTEVKLKHIIKYIDMNVGTIDFELGLFSGLMTDKFKLMLKLYRESSDVYYYQRDRINSLTDDGYIYAQRLVVMSTCFSAIIAHKGEFMESVDRYMTENKQKNELIRKCKRDKTCSRRFNQPSEDLGPEDFETDYFGHMVPKDSKVTYNGTARVEQLLEMEEKILDTPYEKLPKVSVPHDNFTKLNDWLRYLANGGMEKNKLRKNKIDHDKDDFYELTRTEELPTTPISQKKSTRVMRFTSYLGPTFPTDDGFMGIDQEMEQMRTSRKPKIPWGVRGSDFEVKKKVRDEYRERMRAGFDPKREGIDIELPYDY